MPVLILVGSLLGFSNKGWATPPASLSVSGATGLRGAYIALDLSLNGGGGALAAAQWDLNYSTADLSLAPGIYYFTGIAAGAAGKSVACNTISAGDLRCVAAGPDTNAIGNGVLATISFKIVSTTTH